MAELRISADKVCALIEALRELGGMDTGIETDADDIGDESQTSALEERDDDPRREEISEMLGGLNDDERMDLMALALVGREEFSVEEWGDALAAAEQRIADDGVDSVVPFLVGDDAAPEFLEAGLAAFGRDCEDWDAETVTPSAAAATAAPEDTDDGRTADMADAAQRQTPGVPPNLVTPVPPRAARPSGTRDAAKKKT